MFSCCFMVRRNELGGNETVACLAVTGLERAGICCVRLNRVQCTRCQLSGSRSGTNEVCTILEKLRHFSAEFCPTFRDSIVVTKMMLLNLRGTET